MEGKEVQEGMVSRREAREVESRKRRAQEDRGVVHREKVVGEGEGVEEAAAVGADGAVGAAEVEAEVSNSNPPLAMHSPLRRSLSFHL